jgi:chitinase
MEMMSTATKKFSQLARAAIEGFFLTLFLLVGATLLLTPSASAQALPSLSINNVTVTEADSGTQNASFTVTLSAASDRQIRVEYMTRDSSAIAGVDYTPLPLTVLEFAPGDLAKTVTVPVAGDLTPEEDETFSLELARPSNATISTTVGRGTCTILDNETPALSISDVRVTEAKTAAITTGSIGVTFTVRLSKPSKQPVTVNFATANGTAVATVTGDTPAPGDYQAKSGTLTLAAKTETQAGEVSKTITVLLDSSTTDETDEVFYVNLSNAVNGTIADSQGTATITRTAPSIGINDVVVAEGNNDTVNASFTVRLSGISVQPITINWATSNGTATADDYTAVPADAATPLPVITFNPGIIEQNVTVAIKGDVLDEVIETFFVTLTTPTNATLAPFTVTNAEGNTINFGNKGTGSIFDDDSSVRISVSDVAINEGNAGTVTATFNVSLSAVSGKTVTVSYATANGTATAVTDYVALAATTLTFNPGETSKPVSVTVKGDAVIELANETFALNLTNAVNATLLDEQGIGTITEDDLPSISIANVAVAEGNAGTKEAVFTLRLSAASPNAVSVRVASANGTATSGSDYVAIDETVTFAPRQLTKTFAVSIKGDVLDEANETFTLNLSNPRYATLANTSAIGTITDDDATPTLSINDVTVVEGNSGTTNAAFTVTLSAPSGRTVTVYVATANASAVAPGDYTARALTKITFLAGETSKSVVVLVKGDTVIELNETFQVNLTTPVNATIAGAPFGSGQGIGTINDDADRPTLSINDVVVNEGDPAQGAPGTLNADFKLQLSKASPFPVSVTVATANGTASADSDYVTNNTTVTIDAGQTQKTVSIAVRGDLLVELNETFEVTLSTPVNATIAGAPFGSGQGIGTINDNDLPTISINDVTSAEPGVGSVDAIFTVTLSAAAARPVTVTVTTVNATPPNAATAGDDYTNTTATLTFPSGVTQQAIAIPILADTADEADETFLVNLAAPVNATIADNQGIGTIAGNGAPPAISISDVTVTEGNTGTATNATFVVQLSKPTTRTVTVFFATANLTASQGLALDGGDYVAATGTLTFAPGTTRQEVTIVVNGDMRRETTETFTVDLSIPTNATLADDKGQASITNDD